MNWIFFHKYWTKKHFICCEMTSAGSQKHQLGAKRTIFKYQRTIIAFNCKINCVKWLDFSLVSFIFTNFWVVFRIRLDRMSFYPVIRTTGFLGNRWAESQFKFVYLTNDNTSHCDSSIWNETILYYELARTNLSLQFSDILRQFSVF